MRIDAHQHFWKFDPVRDSWITEEMAVIQRDFLPADLKPELDEQGFDGCVAVQASQSEEETEFLAGLAADYPFIKGVVGWVDLRASDVEERLDYFSRNRIIKGFRHVLQGERQRDLMLQPDFRRGIGKLGKHGFTYDILIFPDQLLFSRQLAEAFPGQKFVIDHLAKPFIRRGEIADWKKEMEAIAAHENVCCKVSGMVTEAHWQNWTHETFAPYLDVVVNAFGTSRLLFGSDWPVSLVAGSYRDVVDIVASYFSSFSAEEKAGIFGGNAVTFYQL